MNHAIRITLPYADCSGIIRQWADRSTSCVVYQHDADEEISKTHVHLALYKCEVRAEALKRMWNDAPGSGNGFWSFKDLKIEVENGFMKTNRYFSYMTKGIHAPVYVKNISADLLEEARLSWVEEVNPDKARDSSERIVRKVIAKFNISKSSRYYRADETLEIGCKYQLELLLDHVRTETFKALFAEKGMAPHTSHYKILASTVFLRLCESVQCLDDGIGYLKNLWY